MWRSYLCAVLLLLVGHINSQCTVVVQVTTLLTVTACNSALSSCPPLPTAPAGGLATSFITDFMGDCSALQNPSHTPPSSHLLPPPSVSSSSKPVALSTALSSENQVPTKVSATTEVQTPTQAPAGCTSDSNLVTMWVTATYTDKGDGVPFAFSSNSQSACIIQTTLALSATKIASTTHSTSSTEIPSDTGASSAPELAPTTQATSIPQTTPAGCTSDSKWATVWITATYPDTGAPFTFPWNPQPSCSTQPAPTATTSASPMEHPTSTSSIFAVTSIEVSTSALSTSTTSQIPGSVSIPLTRTQVSSQIATTIVAGPNPLTTIVPGLFGGSSTIVLRPSESFTTTVPVPFQPLPTNTQFSSQAGTTIVAGANNLTTIIALPSGGSTTVILAPSQALTTNVPVPFASPTATSIHSQASTTVVLTLSEALTTIVPLPSGGSTTITLPASQGVTAVIPILPQASTTITAGNQILITVLPLPSGGVTTITLMPSQAITEVLSELPQDTTSLLLGFLLTETESATNAPPVQPSTPSSAAPAPTFTISTGAITATPSFTSSIPSITSPPTPTSTDPTCNPLLEEVWPECSFPRVTALPPTCSPFPQCAFDLMPPVVQSELSDYCNGTALSDCIFATPPPATCTKFPDCLTGYLWPDICDGFPFPDCLFTTYDPVLTDILTTIPPGNTVVTTSNSNWTHNTVIHTTDSGGHNVVWPVIVDPKGGIDWIIKGPPLPWNIRIEFPGFPKIPSFHIPCFLFCPKKGKPADPKHTPTVNPPTTDPWPNLEDPDEEPSSTSESTTTSSSSSCEPTTVTSCRVVESISIQARGTTTTSMSTTCETTEYCTAVGTTKTSTTTTSSSATATPCVIGTKDVDDEAANAQLFADLKNETNSKTLIVYGAPPEIIAFFTQDLTDEQVSSYKTHPAVAYVRAKSAIDYDASPDLNSLGVEPRSALNRKSSSKIPRIDLMNNNVTVHESSGFSTHRRAVGDLHQQTQPLSRNLMAVAAPEGVDFDNVDSYAYREEVPQSARVYILDTGANSNNLYYQNLAVEPSWIWAGSPEDAQHLIATNPLKAYIYREEKRDYSQIGHGTLMMGLVVGTWGVSKGTGLTIVQLPEALQRPGDIAGGLSVIDAIYKVVEDVRHNGLQNKAVMSLSITFASLLPYEIQPGRVPPRNDFNGELFYAFQRAIEEGIVITSAAGNSADAYYWNGIQVVNPTAKILRTIPQVWNGLLPMIVVGNVHYDGQIALSSQYKTHPLYPNSGATVFSPGQVYGPSNAGGDSSEEFGDSTSAANAEVAGLIAYYLGLPEHDDVMEAYWRNTAIPQNPNVRPGLLWSNAVKLYVQHMAYPRTEVQDYNGEHHVDPDYRADVIWNGAIPVNDQGDLVCAIPPPNRKRQVVTGSDPFPAKSSCVAPQASFTSAAPGGPFQTRPSMSLVPTTTSFDSSAAASASSASIRSEVSVGGMGPQKSSTTTPRPTTTPQPTTIPPPTSTSDSGPSPTDINYGQCRCYGINNNKGGPNIQCSPDSPSCCIKANCPQPHDCPPACSQGHCPPNSAPCCLQGSCDWLAHNT